MVLPPTNPLYPAQNTRIFDQNLIFCKKSRLKLRTEIDNPNIRKTEFSFI